MYYKHKGNLLDGLSNVSTDNINSFKDGHMEPYYNLINFVDSSRRLWIDICTSEGSPTIFYLGCRG